MKTLIHAFSNFSLIALMAMSVGAQISFQPSTTIPTAPDPDGIAFADFNGDGALDMAVSGDAPDRVLISLNMGGGTLGAPVGILTGAGTSPNGLAVGDLDGDGDMDVAVVLKNMNALMVLVNNMGTLTPGGTFSTGGAESRRVALGDLDGNGTLDAIVSNRSSNNVSVMLNSTAGGFAISFAPATVIATGAEPRFVAIADLNGDSSLDFAVSNHDSRTVSIGLNGGSGTFSAPLSYTVGAQVRPDGIAAADVNGDGSLDLVTGTSGQGFNFVTVLLNTGTGSFGFPQNYVTGGINPGAVIARDLDGDGDSDVAVANQDSNNVSILENVGGNLGAPTLIAAGTNPQAIASGDLDGNGGIDLGIANGDSASVSILLNSNAGPGSGASLTLVTPPSIGTTAAMLISSPGDSGKGYFAAFSFTASTGFAVGTRTFPLDPDPLFTFSTSLGNPIFLNSFGGLNPSGNASVLINIPNLPGIVGASIHSAFAVADPAQPLGIGTISPALQITFQP